MATKRTPLNRETKHHITADATEAFVRQDSTALHHALGLFPWEPSPLDTVVSDYPYGTEPHHIASWKQSYELRRKLKAALRG